MAGNNTGTVTFLFTDIEGSTALLRQAGAGYADLLDRHRVIIRAAVAEHGGSERGTEGDSFFITFDNPSAAIATAVAAQRALSTEPWPDGLELRVRMGIHLGEATDRGEGPVGLAVHHGARMAATGHGGQIVLSDAARIAAATLPQGAGVMALGSFHVRDVGTVPLHQLTAPGLPVEFPPLRATAEVPGNLPVELSTFIGRTAELKSLVEELDEHRLVTLIGVGGTGKTRLSVEAAREVSVSFPDGCWMVELAAVTVPEAVPFAFCANLNITAPAEGDVLGHLVSRLRDKRMFIIVDNCEHLLAAAADTVERIVSACPQVTVLVTSREPLMIRGERLVPVPSLSPDEAERLFLDRARDEAPDLVIDVDQARAVTELCARLDGLPLALELAASRVRAFSPVELVANLEERFRMLVGGRRSRMERHQTMRGTLDWSYDLCGDVEKAVFDRLSVLPAGFDLAAAKAVAGGEGVSAFDVVDVVPQLLDRSLLQRTTAPDGTTRYRMLETMRAYGREHLHHQGTADTIRAHHARYIAATIAALGLRILGPDEQQVWQRIAAYLPDQIVALDWCIEHQDWENAMRLISAGNELGERETVEMVTRLHDAAQAGNAPSSILDELAVRDQRTELVETSETQANRGWRMIRSGPPAPTDRAAFPPQGAFSGGNLSASDADEFIGSLAAWRSAGPVNRFFAEWFAARALAHAGLLDRVDQPVADLALFAEGLRSTRAEVLINELRGTIARERRDWIGAAHWYANVVEAANGQLRTWLDLISAWYLLTARCLGPGHAEITGGDLRDPWLCFRMEHLDILQWRGAIATAIALHRLGRTDLADRFATWAYRNDSPGIMHSPQFGDLLDLAGLPTTAVDTNDDLDTLIDEVLVVADELDAAAPALA